MNLTEWAHAQGIDVTTAYRWYREGAARLGAEGWPADPGVPRYGLYARVSCHGLPVVRVEAEVGSGVDGARARARRLLADPAVAVVVVEHRDRLGRMNTELVEAALAAHGRRLVVLEDGEVTGDLVRDMIEVLTSFCARLYGRRAARNRALKAVGCAQRDIGPQAVLEAGSAPRGGSG